MKKLPKKTELSIIILTYNSESLVAGCLDSIYKFNKEKFVSKQWELIVVDNNSSDETLLVIQKRLGEYPNLSVIANKNNAGFGLGNNIGVKKAKGDYILFMNPDMVTEEKTISFPLDYIKSHNEVGAVSAKTILKNGELDVTCHRGFPTPWNSFCYFSGLSKIFSRIKLFSGYTLGYLDLNVAHEVDAINGAYMMIPKTIGERLGWFDEDFFWKGEDLDFCYRIKALGYKIVYLPVVRIWHFKGSSYGHKPKSKTLASRFEVMRLFFDKHYKDKYPRIVRELVFLGIKLKEILANLGV